MLTCPFQVPIIFKRSMPDSKQETNRWAKPWSSSSSSMSWQSGSCSLVATFNLAVFFVIIISTPSAFIRYCLFSLILVKLAIFRTEWSWFAAVCMYALSVPCTCSRTLSLPKQRAWQINKTWASSLGSENSYQIQPLQDSSIYLSHIISRSKQINDHTHIYI